MVRQLNLSKIVKKISSDLDKYKQSETAAEPGQESDTKSFGNSSEDDLFDDNDSIQPADLALEVEIGVIEE